MKSSEISRVSGLKCENLPEGMETGEIITHLIEMDRRVNPRETANDRRLEKRTKKTSIRETLCPGCTKHENSPFVVVHNSDKVILCIGSCHEARYVQAAINIIIR